MLDILAIKQRLPHRYPFLMVDRVIEWEPGKRAVGIKNVTVNEPFFNGHYPEQPIMPGVLIAEAMAQVGGLAIGDELANPDVSSADNADNSSEGAAERMLPLFVGIDDMRFRRIVVPGDQLRIETEVLRFRRGMAKIAAKATVDGEMACEGTLMFALRSASELRSST